MKGTRMAAHRIFVIRVKEYDFALEDFEDSVYEPSMRESLYLFSPFVVSATTKEEALSKLSDRVGWCILDAIFEDLRGEEVYSLNKFLN
jgi:hypothetical protein